MNQKAERFLSLDVFRGMALCFMIIVNTPGGGATPFALLEHAAWHGFTPTDLVFPSFLFAVGNAMSFSMKKYNGMDNSQVVLKVLKRTFLIFIIGYLLSWFPFFKYDAQGHMIASPLAHTRIFGVLQRIALCFGIASLMIHFLSTRTVIWLSIIFLLGYWAILLFCGQQGSELTMTGNVGYFIDKYLLGESHMYHGEGIAFDPEGILSTFPSIVNVVIGYYAGRFIQEKGKSYETIAKILFAGCLLLLIALSWNLILPFNKKIWTSSFVMLTCGIDLLLIGSLIFLVEIKQYIKWTYFFVVFGKNPLFIYIVADMLMQLIELFFPNAHFFSWINKNLFQAVAPGPVGSLLFAIGYMLACWLVGLILDKRKIYIRV